jgi:hypothetical protein
MTAANAPAMSAECVLARTVGYEGLHAECRQLRDVPLPHARRVLLVLRCRCSCHRQLTAAKS